MRCEGALDASSKTENKVRLDFLFTSWFMEEQNRQTECVSCGLEFVNLTRLRLNYMDENENSIGYNPSCVETNIA